MWTPRIVAVKVDVRTGKLAEAPLPDGRLESQSDAIESTSDDAIAGVGPRFGPAFGATHCFVFATFCFRPLPPT